MILLAAALTLAGFATGIAAVFVRRRRCDPRPGLYGHLNDWGGKP